MFITFVFSALLMEAFCFCYDNKLLSARQLDLKILWQTPANMQSMWMPSRTLNWIVHHLWPWPQNTQYHKHRLALNLSFWHTKSCKSGERLFLKQDYCRNKTSSSSSRLSCLSDFLTTETEWIYELFKHGPLVVSTLTIWLNVAS